MISPWILGFIFLIIKLSIIMIVLLTVAAYLVWVERKLLGRMQVRYRSKPGGSVWAAPASGRSDQTGNERGYGAGRRKQDHFPPCPGSRGRNRAAHLCRDSLWDRRSRSRGRPIPLVITDLNVGLLYFLPSLPSVSTGSHWADGPPIPSTAFWAASGARPR